MKFFEKYKDPRWQKKRLEILNRDGWCCQKCFDGESTLNVHHRRYISNRDPWDYPSDMLITLCESCHDTEKEEMQEAIGSISDQLQDKFLAHEIHTLAQGINMISMAHAPDVVANMLQWIMRDREVQAELVNRYFESMNPGRQNIG